jgi:hypothetical protein
MVSSSAEVTSTAAEAGRAEGMAVDARLRALEEQERAARLEGLTGADARSPSEYGSVVDVERLKARLEELTAFRQAVQGSFVWRAAQALRRVLGRAW